MLFDKNFIVTIGDHGTLVALYHKGEVKNKILVKELTSGVEKELKKLFIKNKSANIKILLDTADQSYKRKLYPAVKKSDLTQIIKRDMSAEGDKTNVKNFVLFKNSKGQKLDKENQRIECLFVSSSIAADVNKWISFLLEMPNQTSGIYMLPIETIKVIKLLKSSINQKINIARRRNEIYCLISQTKVGGLRQTIFSDKSIIFTRTLSYAIDDENAMEKYEHDLYSAFEYLKRILPDLRISEFSIINILPRKNIDEILQINNVELNLINFTPNQVALECGYPKILPQNSNYCDLLFSKLFASSKKKILKFSTPKLSFFGKFFLALNASYILNFILVIAFLSLILFKSFSEENHKEEVQIAKVAKISAQNSLTEIKKINFDDSKDAQGSSQTSIERIIDMGKNDQLFGAIKYNISQIYDDVKFSIDSDILIESLSYTMPKFDRNRISGTDYEITFSGKMMNKSGDIEDLFKKFDSLIASTKTDIKGKIIKHNEIPRNIDFNKKYYSMPVNFVITKAKNEELEEIDDEYSKK